MRPIRVLSPVESRLVSFGNLQPCRSAHVSHVGNRSQWNGWLALQCKADRAAAPPPNHQRPLKLPREDLTPTPQQLSLRLAT